MSIKRISFKEYLKPFKQKIELRPNVKLTRKNINKLRECWINFCIKEYGNTLETLFFTTYSECFENAISNLIPQGVFFYNNVKYYPYHQPVVLRIGTWYYF